MFYCNEIIGSVQVDEVILMFPIIAVPGQLAALNTTNTLCLGRNHNHNQPTDQH